MESNSVNSNYNQAMANVQDYFNSSSKQFEKAMEIINRKATSGEISVQDKEMLEKLKEEAIKSSQELAEQLNKIMKSMEKDYRFHPFVDGTDLAYVEVINPNTNKVIKQIPPEQMIEALLKIHNAIGVILDKYL